MGVVGEYKSPCGCAIHVVRWTSKKNSVSVKYCSFHKGAEEIGKRIIEIMKTYHRQIESGNGLGTPGGLEHMGDVWSKFLEWEEMLKG